MHRTWYKDQLHVNFKTCNLDHTKLKTLAEDRSAWREECYNAVSGFEEQCVDAAKARCAARKDRCHSASSTSTTHTHLRHVWTHLFSHKRSHREIRRIDDSFRNIVYLMYITWCVLFVCRLHWRCCQYWSCVRVWRIRRCLPRRTTTTLASACRQSLQPSTMRMTRSSHHIHSVPPLPLPLLQPMNLQHINTLTSCLCYSLHVLLTEPALLH